MKRTKKVVVTVVFALVVAIAAVVGLNLNQLNTTTDEKEFTIVIQSERDDFEKTIECSSDLGTLGEYVRTLDECKWEDSDYGTYITGWYDYDQDLDNQYWWAIYEDGEQATNGADLMELEDGHEYEFILIQGW